MARYPCQQPKGIVVLDERSGLIPVYVETVTDHVLGVIGSTTVQKPRDQRVVVQLHEQNPLQGLFKIVQKGIKCLRLGKVSGKTVEKPPAGRCFEALTHDSQDQSIADQFPPGHDGFHLLPKITSSPYLCSE